MATVVFPNIPTDHFLANRRRGAWARPIHLKAPVDRSHNTPMTVGTPRVKVEWPPMLVEPTSSGWLARGKVDSEKRMQGREQNLWLTSTRGQMVRPPANLKEMVRKGLQDAGKVEDNQEKTKDEREERIPLPLCEEIPEPVEVTTDVVDEGSEIVDQMKTSLILSPYRRRQSHRAVSHPAVKGDKEPWRPRSMADHLQERFMRPDKHEVMVKDPSAPSSFYASPAQRRQEAMHRAISAKWLADSVDRGVEVIRATPEEFTLPESVSSASVRGSMLDLPSASGLDQWVMSQDVVDSQSEGSIVTLSSSDLVPEDFDDFADMEHELSQWVSRT